MLQKLAIGVCITALLGSSVLAATPTYAAQERVQGAFTFQNTGEGDPYAWGFLHAPTTAGPLAVDYSSTRPEAKSLVDFPVRQAGSHGPIKGAGSNVCLTIQLPDAFNWQECDGGGQQDFEWHTSDRAGQTAAKEGNWVLKVRDSPFYIGDDAPLRPTQDETHANIIHVAQVVPDAGRVRGTFVFQNSVNGSEHAWGSVHSPTAIGAVTISYSQTKPSKANGEMSFPAMVSGNHGPIRGIGPTGMICFTALPAAGFRWERCDGSPYQDFAWAQSDRAGQTAARPGSWVILTHEERMFFGEELPSRPTSEEYNANIIDVSSLLPSSFTAQIDSVNHEERSAHISGLGSHAEATISASTPTGDVLFEADNNGRWGGTISGLAIGENRVDVTQTVNGITSPPITLVIIVSTLQTPIVDPIMAGGAAALSLLVIGAIVFARRRHHHSAHRVNATTPSTM